MTEEQPQQEEKPFVKQWDQAISRRRLEEAAEALEKTKPPKEVPPLEEQPTHVMNPETGEIERVA